MSVTLTGEKVSENSLSASPFYLFFYYFGKGLHNDLAEFLQQMPFMMQHNLESADLVDLNSEPSVVYFNLRQTGKSRGEKV